MEWWQLWPIVGGVKNAVAEEDWHWDLNLGPAAIEKEDHKALGEKGEDHAAFLSCHSKSGQVWPHGMEAIISKLSRRCCNQGELLPSYISVSYTHLTLPTTGSLCRSRWSPYH